MVRPPVTPPYLLILFATIHLLWPVIEITYGDNKVVRDAGAWALAMVNILCPVAFVWIAGTLPLRVEQPGLKVAGHHDVRNRNR